MSPIPFFRHDLGQPELDAIAEVFTGPILTTGETVERFERAFSDYLGRRHTLALTSCTGGLHLSLLAYGIGAGDEVITTPLTFIATSTAILEAGARPVFVDVEPETGNLDAAQIERAITPRTRAILPVHLYGHMCDMRAIRAIADRHQLRVVEDAAHCIEGVRDGIKPGQLGDTACFSYYATKNLTCGEGGSVVCDDDELAQRLRLLRLHGMSKTAFDRSKEGYRDWDITVLGWKYNLDNIHAAILLAQMGRLESNLRRREALAARYDQALADIRGVSRPQTLPGVRHAQHLYTVWVDPARRDGVIAGLQKMGIGAMVNYRAIHLLTYFHELLGHKPGDFPRAERIGASTLSLPFYPAMPLSLVDEVADGLRMALGRTDVAIEGSSATVVAAAAPSVDEAPVEVIAPRRGRLAVDWTELWRHRELLYFLAWRDIKLRYKQTVFGAAWALLQPLLTMLIFALFFGRFAGLGSSTHGVPYPLYVFTGLLPWMFFANSITNASNSVVSSANLITKVYFPRLVVPFAAVGVAFLDLALSFGVLAALFGWYRWAISWQVALLPLLLVGLALFTLGVGAVLAALNVAYRDFRFVVPFVVQTWMFVTPVIYPASIVPERYRWILWLNPVAGLVEGFRAALLGGPVTVPGLGLALAGSLLTFLVGVSYFRGVERGFADMI